MSDDAYELKFEKLIVMIWWLKLSEQISASY